MEVGIKVSSWRIQKQIGISLSKSIKKMKKKETILGTYKGEYSYRCRQDLKAKWMLQFYISEFENLNK